MPDNPDIAIPWPGWRAVRRLGRGAYGSVWEIERDVAGEPERCALKVVSIPPEGDWDGSLGLGYDEGTLSESYGKQADQVLHEYQLMASLSHSNIVACRDVAKVSHAGDPGCDVFIRMELLTPLPRWLKGRDADPRLAARVGRDIARALEACEKRGVVHRDVKPANIMVDEWGDFKLGDFGVARTMEGTRTATVAGTQSFMAPEVERHERYNQTVDIYSLGLVMWWMLNGYRGPFMPAGSIAPGDVARAEAMRLQGEPIPTPDNCPSELACIVLRACAYRPGDRYQSAAELVKDLDAFLEGRRIPAPEPNITEPVMHGGRETGTEENNWDDAGDVTIGRDLGSRRSNVMAGQAEDGEKTVGAGWASKNGREGSGAEEAHPGNATRLMTHAAEKTEAEAKPHPASPVAGKPQDPAARRQATSKGHTASTQTGGGDQKAAQERRPKRHGIAIANAIAALVAVVDAGILAMPTGSSDAGSSTGTSQTTNSVQANTGSSSTSSASGSAGVGSTVTLGSYEQDGNTSDGAEPIEWRVLAVDGGKGLLISEYALDTKPFNEDDDDGNGWDTSSLKAWLQGEFASDAGLSEYADGLTLLSADEAERFFSSDDDRMCAPTKYAIGQGAWQSSSFTVHGTGACYWWLRSAGSHSNFAAYVSTIGYVNTDGHYVDLGYVAVRPALWIDL